MKDYRDESSCNLDEGAFDEEANFEDKAAYFANTNKHELSTWKFKRKSRVAKKLPTTGEGPEPNSLFGMFDNMKSKMTSLWKNKWTSKIENGINLLNRHLMLYSDSFICYLTY